MLGTEWGSQAPRLHIRQRSRGTVRVLDCLLGSIARTHARLREGGRGQARGRGLGYGQVWEKEQIR